MKLLLLGGPKFVGRALIEAALGAGHEVTTFNRGQTNPELFPGVEKLHGDRHGDLSALSGRTWDAVFDTSAYEPQVVHASAGRYVFVSTIGVYADLTKPIPEDAPLAQVAEGHPSDELLPDYANYGPLKALCEQALLEHYGERALIVRPGLIVGAYDSTDRFTYWPRRAERGGRILAPAPPDNPVQVIDVRDLVGWMLRMAERGEAGTFNATSPPGALDFASMLEACGAENVAWVDGAFLLERDVKPWADLPVWIPQDDPEMGFLLKADVSRALAAGLTFRPLAVTAREVPEWRGEAGLPPAREAELLAEWDKAAA